MNASKDNVFMLRRQHTAINRMRPFFSYYGAKYNSAKHYGPPRRRVVIEPFAGSACYSTYWGVRYVKLYDISEEICCIWDFLINSSCRDIEKLPDFFERSADMYELPYSQRLLCSFWVAKGRAEPSGTLSPWYHKYKNSNECRVWGPAVKRRIIQQKPRIANWTIDNVSYENIPVADAHWHVDPPYDNAAGRRYRYSDIDYNNLSEWCLCLPGSVDVCENEGATWLPFERSHSVVSSRGRKSGTVSREAVWSK